MGKRLFVGNLAYDATEAQVREPFAAVGKVISVRMIIDRESGRFKGFAFVEMSTDAEATAAITTCNNKEIAGRRMIVSEARPMGEKPAPRPGGPSPRPFSPGLRPSGPGGGPSMPPSGFGAPVRDFNRARRVKPEWEKRRDEREREAAEEKRRVEKDKRNPKYHEIDSDEEEEGII